jgi:hypothetical protein
MMVDERKASWTSEAKAWARHDSAGNDANDACDAAANHG